MIKRYVFRDGELAEARGAMLVDGFVQRISDKRAIEARRAQIGNITVRVPRDVSYLTFYKDDLLELGRVPQLPEIAFGLQKAGALAFGERFEVPKAMAPANNSDAARVRPAATQGDHDDFKAAASAVRESFRRAAALQAEARGYFLQPFKIRYALRMKDGSISRLSDPIEIYAPQLPPCLALESVEEGEKGNIISLSGAACPFFELRCRIAQSINPAWEFMIEGIDIFVTPSILTYDPKAHTMGISPYRLSNIENPNDLDAYLGTWSDGNDNYSRHTLASEGLSSVLAWDLGANPSFKSKMIGDDEYFLVARLPLSEIVESDSYRAVSIISTADEDIKRLEKLREEAIIKSKAISPEAVAAHCNRLFTVSAANGGMCLVNISKEGQPFSLDQQCLCGSGRPIAILPAKGASLDKCPMYVFTDQGVWLMSQAESGFAVRRQVTDIPCIDNQSISEMDDGYVYGSSRGIVTLRGQEAVLTAGEYSRQACEFATAPILVDGAVQEAWVEGRIAGGGVSLRLEASHCGALWHTVATSQTHRIGTLRGSAYRYYRLRICLSGASAIRAAVIKTSDG